MDGSLKHAADDRADVAVVGAGIAGLATTLRLAAAGCRVTLLERHAHVGGKIRTVPSPAGPIDAGPTVLTLRDVFDDLFAAAGARLEQHVRLHKQSILARHFWPDGSQLDLHEDIDLSVAAISRFAGSQDGDAFRVFCAQTRRLFDAFDVPMMRAATPRLSRLTGTVLRQPNLLRAMAPNTSLMRALRRRFKDPRLQQLFGRYATYVGGAPTHAPALLSLIWQAEAKGVWVVDGGIHKLARTIADLAQRHGATIRTGVHIELIERNDDGGWCLTFEEGSQLASDAVVFAGDPRALSTGQLGSELADIAPQTLQTARSFSARVHSFAAQVTGPALAHHNVFFDSDPVAEFDDLMRGDIPRSPSLYVCAMDRGMDRPAPATERFEIITNAPPLRDDAQQTDPEEVERWHATIMQRLTTFGLSFDPPPSPGHLTTETQFAAMFPGSLGALYGQTPHGLTASLKRPTTRTRHKGFYLAGGGCHPGAGVPMATLSAKHAAEAILSDLTSASMSHRTVMRGGISTA